jgi:hypothetical protein
VQDAHLPERQAERVRRATAGHYGGDGGTNWGAVAGAGILGALLGAAATPRRRDQVVGEVAGQQLPFCVIDEVFKEGAAQPLDHAADRLAVQCQRVDDAANILDDETVEQFDIARSRVDRDMRRRRSVGVGQPVVVAECRRDPQAVRRQLGECQRAPVGGAGASIRQFDLFGGIAQSSGTRSRVYSSSAPR